MSPPGKKGSWSKPLADFIGKVIDPALARQGFGQADVVLHWDEIVGERLAAFSQPLKLSWPPRGPRHAPDAAPEPSTLVVRVNGPAAIEVQHLAPVIIERVNAHLGWRCIGRLQIKQGPLEPRSKRSQPPPPPGPEAVQQAGALTQNITDDSLRDALTRLGARVLSQRTPPI